MSNDVANELTNVKHFTPDVRIEWYRNCL